MKFVSFFLTIFIGSIDCNNEGKLACKATSVNVPQEWITMVEPCTKKLLSQIQEELVAAMTYFAMGAHFARDSINRPGFAKFFFNSANEERMHAIKLIDYFLMRGGGNGDLTHLINDPMPKEVTWPDAITALKQALSLEASVTQKLRNIAITCEDPGKQGDHVNDYHLVDWIINEYLDEQYKGQRVLAHLITKLGKMMDQNGALGEDMIDKKLLLGEELVAASLGA